MVTLDTISRFGGTGKMLLDAQGTGLESAGVMHRLKSFFNFGDARAKNAATLNAIRSAVLSDPRFAPADLQAQAQRLLDDVRTDRAIDASQIKGLVKALKKLADPTKPAALDRRVDLHMAAIDLPPGFAKYASEVAHIAKLQARQIAAAGNPVDVADVVGKSLNTFKAALFRSPLKHYGRTFTDFVCRNLRRFAVDENHMLRDDDEVTDLVRSTFKFYTHANKVTFDRVNARGGIAADMQKCTSYTHAYGAAAFKFMDTVGRPLTKDHFDIIDDHASSMSDTIKGMLKTNPSAGTVRLVVDQVKQQMRRLPIANDEGEPLFGRDDKANMALARYVGRLISLNLPDDTRDAIRTNLHVDSVSEMFAQMAYVGIYKNAH